ncbi:MAG: hypothetical protein ACRD19_05340 [Terriglobia bacterium]
MADAIAWAQDVAQPAAASQASQSGKPSPATLRVIVPWTHFKPLNAPAAAAITQASTAPQPQTSDTEIVSPQLSTTDLPSAGDGHSTGPAPPESGSQAPVNGLADSQPGQPVPILSNAQSQQLYEEDISKKHPHPPEPVKLPPADQTAAPLSDSEEPAPPADVQNPPRSQTEAAGANTRQTSGAEASAANETAEARIAALTAGYEGRRQDREAKLKSLQASAANDPAAQSDLEMQETRLGLEGEQDRMQTGQELSKQFALLAGKLDQRAAQVGKMIEDRKQTALSAQAGLDQMNDLLPRRELALRNLAALPASGDNDQMIQDLKTELTQDEATQKIDQERGQEAGLETQALEAEAAQLSQAAAKARQRSSTYAAIAQNAQANQDRLADRMESDLARQRAAGMLASVSKVIDPAPALGGAETPAIPVTPPATAAAGTGTSTPAAAPQEAGNLRECLRKTGNVDACLAQQGAP